MNTGANGFMSVKLDEDTKIYLEGFQKVHNNHKDKYKNQQLNFKELIIDLGNSYVSKRVELKSNFNDIELNQKLEKLEIAFSVYNEEKVVGEIKDVGTMANEVHFTLVVAKSDRYIKEAIEAVKNGKSAKSAVKRDITTNDKDTLNNILQQAKKILFILTDYLNEDNITLTENSIDKYFSEKIEDKDWSFKKLMMTFELLDRTKGAKENRYSADKFMEVVESEEITQLFSGEEINIFILLYNIYN